MKFWTPKVQTEENAWSVILHPLKGELDKKRVSEKISDLFRLSYEEARELVQSTPLIILDDLSRETALGVQNIFQEVRAEVSLSSDSVVKRRCYRAVWPQMPDLSFLLPKAASPVPAPAAPAPAPSQPSAPVQDQKSSFSEGLLKLERKYQELQILYEQRNGEIQELKNTLEKRIQEKVEKESSSLRSSLQDWEERYQNLREEYQETKSIYEEKLLQQKQEIESLRVQLKDLGLWQEKASQLTRELEEYRKTRGLYEEEMLTQEKELESLEKDQLRELADWQEKAAVLTRELEEHRKARQIFEQEMLSKEKEMLALQNQLKELSEWQEKAAALSRQIKEHQEGRMSYEQKILTQERDLKTLREQLKDLSAWQEKAIQLEEKSESLAAENQNLLQRLNESEAVKRMAEQSSREQADAVNLWREKYQTLAQKSERFEALYEEERKRRNESDEARRQIADLADRTRREIETQVAETEKWRQKFQELEASQKRLEQEFSQFSEEQNAEAKRLRETNTDLTLQLETAQRQVRDLLSRVEQQDLVEKRSRLVGELTDKEARLRELALESERLRQEIQDRELRAQTLGGEQANLERELLEVKQAQRHLLEQTKMREKNQKFKRLNNHNHPAKNFEADELGVDNAGTDFK